MLSNPKPEFAIQGEGLGKDALADLHLTRQEVVNKVTIDCVLCWQQNLFAQVFSYWMCFRPRMCSLTRMCSRRWTRHRRGVLTTWSPGSMTQRAFCRCMPGSVLLFASRSVFPNFFYLFFSSLPHALGVWPALPGIRPPCTVSCSLLLCRCMPGLVRIYCS